MTGIIWYYTNRKNGLFQFQQLIKDYERMKIYPRKTVMNSATAFVQFDNDDYWSLAPATDSARGSVCNVGLIECATPEKIVNEVIMPCIKGLPYRAYNFW